VENTSKDSLLVAEEFSNAKKLRTLQGAKINSPNWAQTNFCCVPSRFNYLQVKVLPDR